MFFEAAVTNYSITDHIKIISVVRASLSPLNYLHMLNHGCRRLVILYYCRIICLRLSLPAFAKCLLLSLRHVLYTASLTSCAHLFLEIDCCVLFWRMSGCMSDLLLHLVMLLFEQRGALMRLISGRFDGCESRCVLGGARLWGAARHIAVMISGSSQLLLLTAVGGKEHASTWMEQGVGDSRPGYAHSRTLDKGAATNFGWACLSKLLAI